LAVFGVNIVAESGLHFVNMTTLGLAGSSAEGSNYTARTLLTAFQPGADAEGIFYTTNIGFFSQPVPAGPAISKGGISRGWKVPECTYDWVCTEWFPKRCPEEGIQKRVCYNEGSCTGTKGKPEEERICDVEVKGPLFDLFMEIQTKFKRVIAGDTISMDLELINVGDVTKLDVFLKYWILDANDTLVYEKQETRAVEQGIKFKADLELPKNLKPGTYRVYTQIFYDEGRTALGGDSIEVVAEKVEEFSWWKIILVLVSIIIILWFVYAIYYIYKIKKDEEPKSRFFRL
jgi:hypothetical protein